MMRLHSLVTAGIRRARIYTQYVGLRMSSYYVYLCVYMCVYIVHIPLYCP